MALRRVNLIHLHLFGMFFGFVKSDPLQNLGVLSHARDKQHFRSREVQQQAMFLLKVAHEA